MALSFASHVSSRASFHGSYTRLQYTSFAPHSRATAASSSNEDPRACLASRTHIAPPYRELIAAFSD